MIDVLLPEGLERQRNRPTTVSGRLGVSTEGANQAFARARRVPVVIGGVDGHLRRPDLLGALVLKASAHTTDSRDKDRHAQDLVVLSELALIDPRAVLLHVTAQDRRRLRPAVRALSSGERSLRSAADPGAVLQFLRHLAGDGA